VGQTFRESMAWLHTWAGVVLGALLFAIFWMGTLAVFDKEIDRWMMPETRVSRGAGPGGAYSYDAALAVVSRQLALEGARDLWLSPPQARVPVAELWYRAAEGGWEGPLFLDPRTHERLTVPQTEAGSGFIFPFHFNLHLRWLDLGYWLVGLAAMAMLALLVSGVVVHRKLLADFFTFRRERRLPRSSLDLHNLTGVLALPFHFVITLSGLIIFFGIYFPSVEHAVYGEDHAAFDREVHGSFEREPAGEPGSLASLDAMVAKAARRWGDEPLYGLWVVHPNDRNGHVAAYRSRDSRVAWDAGPIHFDAATGAVLDASAATAPVAHARSFIAGLHFIQFEHWSLRWLYFVLGLCGCVMIATGYVYWLETRRKKHAALGLPGVRIVDGLTVGSVSGIVVATLVFLVANRLLPAGASLAGADRAALEMGAFYLAWLASFAHAWARPERAWREQCRIIAGLAVLATVLNWATTGDHLPATIAAGYWPVAGMDLLLLAGAAVAGCAARRLSRARLHAAASPPVDAARGAQARHG